MKIQTFRNMKGLIYGSDPKRIGCDKEGVLIIGCGNTTEIRISPESDSIMPLLFHGCTGEYPATYTTSDGKTYDLGKVELRSGRIAPPSPTAMEIMELRCRADAAEEECDVLREEIRELRNIFDTNSLNFLIK